MLKSHKVGKHSSDNEEAVEAPRRRRKMSLAQLEQKVAKRRRSSASSGFTNIIKALGNGMKKLNQGMNQQSRRMPSSHDINKDIWGF